MYVAAPVAHGALTPGVCVCVERDEMEIEGEPRWREN